MPAVRADVQYDRRVKVTVALPLSGDFKTVSGVTVEVTDLRVEFDVKKTLKSSANTAAITITNLAEKTRAQMQARAAKVILEAGYANSLSTLFVGDARLIDHTRDGADWKTKIECGDGERALLHARTSESFAPGIKLPDVAAKLGKALGLDPGNITAKLAGNKTQFVNGYVAHGRTSAELDKILRAAGYEWSVQDGRVQVLAPGETNTERIVVLSSESGLIGSPEMATPRKKGGKAILKFKSLLSADIRPGGRVEFASEKHRGVHRVIAVKMTGDTAGGAWYTEGEAEVNT